MEPDNEGHNRLMDALHGKQITQISSSRTTVEIEVADGSSVAFSIGYSTEENTGKAVDHYLRLDVNRVEKWSGRGGI